MYINFNDYLLAKPNDCDVNYIDIYENILSEEKRKARFCGTATEPQKSDGNVINIRFHAKEGVVDKVGSFHFEILFTAFRTNDRGESYTLLDMKRQNVKQIKYLCQCFPFHSMLMMAEILSLIVL